jgi:hypothetical protein
MVLMMMMMRWRGRRKMRRRSRRRRTTMSDLLDQFAELDSYSVSSLKQPSADRHVALP